MKINAFIVGNDKGLGELKELEKAENSRKRIRLTN